MDVVIWSIRYFQFNLTSWSIKKSCRRPSDKILTKILLQKSSCDAIAIFWPIWTNFMIYRKNRQKMNFKPFYTHKGFDSQNFPYFKKYLLGRSLIALKHFSIGMPPYARTREWNIFGWRKKIQSSAVPIRLLANKKSLCAIVEYIEENLARIFK